MAFEKECDMVLRLLRYSSNLTVEANHINLHFINNGINLSTGNFMDIISILIYDQYIYEKETLNYKFDGSIEGVISISLEGVTFFAHGGYIKQKEFSDLQMQVQISTFKALNLAGKQYFVNFCIAVSTGIAAFYYLLELRKDYNINLNYLSWFFFGLGIGALIMYLIPIILKQIKKIEGK